MTLTFAHHKEIECKQTEFAAHKVGKGPKRLGHTRFFNINTKNSHIQGLAQIYIVKLVLTGSSTLLFVAKAMLTSLLFIEKPMLVFSAGKQWNIGSWLSLIKHTLSEEILEKTRNTQEEALDLIP